VTFTAQLTLRRKSVTNSEIRFTQSVNRTFDKDDIDYFFNRVKDHLTSHFTLLGILPRMIKMPGMTGDPKVISPFFNVSAECFYIPRSNDTRRYWRVEQDDFRSVIFYHYPDQTELFEGEGLQFLL